MTICQGLSNSSPKNIIKSSANHNRLDSDKESQASSPGEGKIERIEESLRRINKEFDNLKINKSSLAEFNTRIIPFVDDLFEKDRSKWKLYAIFIIIISLLVGSIAFLLDDIFTGLVDVPAVHVQIVSTGSKGNSNALIQVANEGKIPVTNLNLTIKLPEGAETKRLTNLTSVDAMWKIISPTILKAHVNKFTYGTGAVMYISIPITENQTFNCNDYNVYVVYNEGSTRGSCPAFDVIYQFNLLHTSVKIGILVTLTIILSSILLIFIPRYWITFIIRKKRK
jgi:hypothetical protein